MKRIEPDSARISRLIDERFNGNQSEFARAVGIGKGTVSEWISGVHAIRRGTLVKIANQLREQVNYDWLVYGYGEMTTPSRPTAPGQTGEGVSKQKPPVEKTERNRFKERINEFFDRKIEKAHMQSEAKKEALRELREETLRELEEFLRLSD